MNSFSSSSSRRWFQQQRCQWLLDTCILVRRRVLGRRWILLFVVFIIISELLGNHTRFVIQSIRDARDVSTGMQPSKIQTGAVPLLVHKGHENMTRSNHLVGDNEEKETEEADGGGGGRSDKDLFLERGLDAIVTIATGSFSAMRLVSALRDIGEFHKPIFILTDKVDSRDLDGYNVTLVDITHHKPTFDTESGAQAWKNAKIAKVKWYKTQIFHLIPSNMPQYGNETSNNDSKKANENRQNENGTISNTKIDNVLYIDADEIINSPMHKFEVAVMQSISSQNKKNFLLRRPFSDSRACSAYFFPERIYISQAVNSGTALYFRNDSQSLLAEWSLEILSGRYERDQIALDATLQRTTNLHVCTFPTTYNYFSADFVTTVWNTITFGHRRKWATFIHPCSTKDTAQMATPYDRSVISNHRLI